MTTIAALICAAEIQITTTLAALIWAKTIAAFNCFQITTTLTAFNCAPQTKTLAALICVPTTSTMTTIAAFICAATIHLRGNDNDNENMTVKIQFVQHYNGKVRKAIPHSERSTSEKSANHSETATFLCDLSFHAMGTCVVHYRERDRPPAFGAERTYGAKILQS